MGRTAGTDASHRVTLDAFATVAGGGTVEAEVQGGTGGVTAANNSTICMRGNCRLQIKNILGALENVGHLHLGRQAQ